MNDLDLLDRFGPSADEPTDATLAAARARLDATMADTSTAAPAAWAKRPNRRAALLVAAAAAAVGIGVVPALVGSDDSIALATVDPLTFPWTPATVPAELGEPVFDKDLGHFGVLYGPAGGGLSVFTQIENEWDLPDGARDVRVQGEDGKLFQSERNGSPTVTVAWEDDDEGETRVTGAGPFADADTVLEFADSLREEPQPVDLSLTVAPSGWAPTFYKANRILTLTQSGEDGPERLTVSMLDRLSPDFSDYMAPRDVHPAEVDGRPATVAQIQGDPGGWIWVLETTSADGQPFQLQAPGTLTEAQVIAIAAGVRHR